MGYSYHASATFPSSAKNIPEIADYLADLGIGVKIEEAGDGSLITVSDDDAGSGELRVTGLLKKHGTPFDHYHRDDNAMREWTELYREKPSGEIGLVASDYAPNSAVRSFAKEVLEALQAGRTEEVYAILGDAIGEEIEDIETVSARVNEAKDAPVAGL